MNEAGYGNRRRRRCRQRQARGVDPAGARRDRGVLLLHAQADWLRWLAVVAGVALGVVVFGSSARGRTFWQFMSDARQELRKVVWPTRQETTMTTAVVFGFVIIAGLFFWVTGRVLVLGHGC